MDSDSFSILQFKLERLHFDLLSFLSVVRKVVCNDATASKLERDALRSPRSTIVSATEGQKIDRMSAQTPKIASLVGSKGRSTTNVTSVKESVAPTSGEKKCILVMFRS